MRYRIKDLASVDLGVNIPKQFLKLEGTHFYLQSKDIIDFNIEQHEGNHFISSKLLSKLNIKPTCLEYGDFIILINESNKVIILQYIEPLPKIVIPSDDIIYLKSDNTFLRNYLIINSYQDALIQSISNFTNIQELVSNLANYEIDLNKSPLLESQLEVEEINEVISPEELKEEQRKAKELIPQIYMPQETKPIQSIISRIEHREINLNTKFQRAPSLWDEDKKSRLIESILLRFPIPAFYFDTTDNDNWLVIDGLQRLSSIKEFAVDKTLRLSNLDFLHELDGKGYDEMDRKLQRDFLDYNIVTYNLRTKNDQIKYNLFKRINSGSLELTSQEIRHALNQGKPAEVLFKFANLPAFKEIVEISEKELKRMKDKEIVLRYLAFRITPFADYRGRMESFLDEAMKKLNSINDEKLREWEIDFEHSLRTLKNIFGEHVFRSSLIDNIPQRKKFSPMIFEAWMDAVSNIPISRRNILKSHSPKLRAIFAGILSGKTEDASDYNFEFDEFNREKSYTDNRLQGRFEAIQKIVEKFSR